MKLISVIITRYPIQSLFLSTVIAFFFLFFIPSIKTIDNVDYFTVDDDPDFAYYEEIKSIFGDDEFFVIAFKPGNVFTENNLRLIKELTEDLEIHPGIRDVQSLANVDYVDGAQDYFEVRKFLASIPDTKDGLQLLREQALSTPLYLDNLISRDASTAALIVYPHERPDEEGFRANLLQSVHDILVGSQAGGAVFHLAGNTVTNVGLSRYVQQDVATFIPYTYIFVALVIWLIFRNFRLTLLAVINITVCVGSTMGFMAFIGISMHNVTSVVPSLVMALALSDTVHIFSCLDKKILLDFPDKKEALFSILDKVIMPCFLTTLTTAVGFISLAVSTIPPIREFAYVASMGMVFEFFFSFFMLIPLLLFCNPLKIYRHMHEFRRMANFLNILNQFIKMRYVLICIVFLFVFICSLWFSGKVQVETNLVEYFNKKSSLRQDLDFIQSNLSGVVTMDISLRANFIDAFTIPENIVLLDKVQSFLHTIPGVDTTVSFADYIKEMNKSFHDEDPEFYVIPKQKNLIAQYLLLYDSDSIEDYINARFDHARILVRISESSSAKQSELIKKTQDFINNLEQDAIQIRITGSVVQQVNVISALTKGLVSSLVLALGVICVIMLLVLRSVRIGLLSLIPNLFPLVLNFGIMGLLSIPLDTSTALISVVALGIAVDDTIHFLTEYNIQRKMGQSISASIEYALLNKGLAIITTSIILCIGFGVLVFSNFVPTLYFGFLSALVMLTALAGDIVLLPAIMLLKKENVSSGLMS